MWDKEELSAKANRYLIAGCITFGIILLTLACLGCDGNSGGTGGVFPIDEPTLMGGPKTVLCHKGKTKEVSDRATAAHLEHGDFLGACPDDEDGDDDGQDCPEMQGENGGDQQFDQKCS